MLHFAIDNTNKEIRDPVTHREVIARRHGTKATFESNDQLTNFDRIRTIHDEMIRLGSLKRWMIIDQKPMWDPKPIELLNKEIQQTSKVETPVWIDAAFASSRK